MLKRTSNIGFTRKMFSPSNLFLNGKLHVLLFSVIPNTGELENQVVHYNKIS